MVRVTFLHPDLGIGGAERLVVDAALALKKKGHEVQFLTTHHDPDHCFPETRDGTFPVTVVGDWLPRSICGRFFAVCAYVRMVYAAIALIFLAEAKPDIVFCDLVSICIPILHFWVPHVMFYCHHPDQLLSEKGGFLKSLYRLPLDYLEEVTTSQADKIFVNSLYTRQIFQSTFKRLSSRVPEVLYPTIHTTFFQESRILPIERVLDRKFDSDSFILLSINRYERKKQLTLALDAVKELSRLLGDEDYKKLHLIMAGGYDKKLEENVEHYLELIEYADELNVSEKVTFLRSPSNLEKVALLSHCSALIYTPVNEHFGIVPLEAMYFEKPVIAHCSGGPRESIVDGVTGYLVEDLHGRSFAEKIALLVKNKEARERFGKAGKDRVINTFSFDTFAEQLHRSVEELAKCRKQRFLGILDYRKV